MIDTAVVTGAGKGTRLRPATQVIPKVLLPLVTVPAIQLVVEEVLEAGIGRVVVVVGRDGELIRRHFEETDGPWHGRIDYAVQPEPRGGGDAIRCARSCIGDNPFALAFGDSVFLGGNPIKTLLSDFKRHREALVAVHRVPENELSKRGVMDVERSDGPRHRLRGVVEKPKPGEAPSNLGVVARYILTPAIFDLLDQVQPDAKGEIGISEALQLLIAREPVTALEICERRLDIGNPRDYVEATFAFARERLGIEDTGGKS